MIENVFSAETPENHEQKCLCVLALDVSGSMQGQPISELNIGLQDFYSEISQDFTASNRLEICIITFGGYVTCIQEPSLVTNFQMPMLTATGQTPLVKAVREAIQKVEDRKQWYKQTGQSYYRPFVVLITDGAPTDNGVNELANEIKIAVDNKKFIFYGIGVQNADMNMLTQICHPNTPPMILQGLKFSEFFKWLSNSISIITKSKAGDTINLPSTNEFTQITI
jgi:uncharacterized protein YegL